MKKTVIQMVGNYYINDLEKYLPDEIYVQNKCIGVSPLVLCDTADERLCQDWETKIKDLNQWKEKPSGYLYLRQTQDLFDLKKNFPKFLSRSKEDYCDNVVFTEMGKEVISENKADYIIVEHSSLVHPLIKNNQRLYSYRWPVSPFAEFLKSDSDSKCFSIEDIEDDFHWKYYFDKYINAILEEYDSSQIILIKTPYSKFYFENNELKRFTKLNPKLEKLIRNMDDYFAERTGCFVIDYLCSRIPTCCLIPHGYPWGNALGKWQQNIAHQILAFIKNPDGYKPSFQNYNFPIAKNLYSRFNAQAKKSFSDLLNKAENQKVTSLKKFSDITKALNIGDLALLDEFIINSDFTLSDYIDVSTANDKMPDLAVVEAYTKFFKCDINDILSIYEIYSQYGCDNVTFDIIISNLCNSNDSLPIMISERQFCDNLKYLENYPYINSQYLDIPTHMLCNRKYLNICDNVWLHIEKKSESQMNFVTDFINEQADYKKIIKNGYTCDIKEADALTYSYDYYVEKARNGDGNKPTYLRFDDEQEFIESLYFINYGDLLKNERFIFIFNSNVNELPDGYLPTVDFTELLDPQIATVRVQNGLGDQLCYYIMGQIIEKYGEKKVIYDDTQKVDQYGFEIHKFSKKPIKLLSHLLSEHLMPLHTYENRIFRTLFSKISKNYIYICNDYERGYKPNAEGNPLLLLRDGERLINLGFAIKMPYAYYHMLIRIEFFKTLFNDFKLNDYIEFPAFEKMEHKELAHKMTSCDSVVIHIRRGDHVTLGWDIDNQFYIESVNKIMDLNVYKNKKFFVFSDDIEWCKNNVKEIGLDLIEDSELVFVENKKEDSYRDIQLMALGKIMVFGSSYFPAIAALYNENLEILICADYWRNKIFKNYIHTNKYDIGELTKNYSKNYSSRTPKQALKN